MDLDSEKRHYGYIWTENFQKISLLDGGGFKFKFVVWE